MTRLPGPRDDAGADVAFALWCVVALLAALLATFWALQGG